MSDLLKGIEEVLLMGPGPSRVPAPVYEAIGMTTIGHLDPYFIRIMDDIRMKLQALMKTRNMMTLPLSSTGSGGMEASFVNLIEKDDQVLILINGVFGKRMQDVAGRLGGKVDVLEFPWGAPVRPEDVARKLRGSSYKMVAVVHAETSTGVRNPVAEIGNLLKGSDTIYLVDVVTSMGGIEVAMDEWGADVVYGGTQKCLSCPPGLSPFSMSEKGRGALARRKTKVPNWYLDLSMIGDYWGKTRVYHHTAPINMLYALHRAMALILEEGPENVFRRHIESHLMLVRGLENLGLKMLVDPEWRLPMLNAVLCPEGIDEAEARKELRNDHMIEIGGGLGELAGKIWRVGLMGDTARPDSVERFLGALRKVMGRKGKGGSGGGKGSPLSRV